MFQLMVFYRRFHLLAGRVTVAAAAAAAAIAAFGRV